MRLALSSTGADTALADKPAPVAPIGGDELGHMAGVLQAAESVAAGVLRRPEPASS